MLKKFIKSIFVSDSKVTNQQNIKKKNSNDVVKQIFTKNDLLSLTKFPYQWEKEFYPPLAHKEKQYMISEITKWFEVYLDLFIEEIIESISVMVLNNSNDPDFYDHFKTLKSEFYEEFNMMVHSIIQQHFQELVLKELCNFSEDELIYWKPIKGLTSWEPPQKQFSKIFIGICDFVLLESKDELEKQQKEIKELLVQQEKMKEIKKHKQNEVEEFDSTIKILIDFMNDNRSEIIKNGFSRLLMEYNSFPRYHKLEEKLFKNELFNKYKINFNISSFNDLMEIVYPRLQDSMELNGKNFIIGWMQDQWHEFISFMEKEYHTQLNENSQLELKHFNKYSVSIDFFAIILFKIYLDGI